MDRAGGGGSCVLNSKPVVTYKRSSWLTFEKKCNIFQLLLFGGGLLVCCWIIVSLTSLRNVLHFHRCVGLRISAES